MMYSTPYPNTSRTISGSAQIFRDDVVLLVDTTTVACSVTLLEIPNDFWNTQWKLYFVPTQTTLSNSITINAGPGQTINGQASIVFPAGLSNRIKITVSSNNSFLATIDTFSTPSDSGWINLNGFNHLAAYADRPQFRIIGNQMFFRGTIIIPLATDDAGSILAPLNLSGANGFYIDVVSPYVFQGANGCTISSGQLQFNLNENIFPSPYNEIVLAKNMSFGLKMLTRMINTSERKPCLMQSVGSLELTTDKKLILKSYEYLENFNGSHFLNNGNGRGGAHQVITNVLEDQYVPNWDEIDGGSKTSSSANNFATIFKRDWVLIDDQFTFTMNASLARNLGGFQLILDGFSTLIN